MQTTLTIATSGPGALRVHRRGRPFRACIGRRRGPAHRLRAPHLGLAAHPGKRRSRRADGISMNSFAAWCRRTSSWVVHTTEGPDDMPAHIKAALTQTSLGIPVAGGAHAARHLAGPLPVRAPPPPASAPGGAASEPLNGALTGWGWAMPLPSREGESRAGSDPAHPARGRRRAKGVTPQSPRMAR